MQTVPVSPQGGDSPTPTSDAATIAVDLVRLGHDICSCTPGVAPRAITTSPPDSKGPTAGAVANLATAMAAVVLAPDVEASSWARCESWSGVIHHAIPLVPAIR